MHLNTYLQFNGNCQAAFKFYEQCLGGKIEAITPYVDRFGIPWIVNCGRAA
jgi:uncharacterized glyoxalase superfamily protein PhnB